MRYQVLRCHSPLGNLISHASHHSTFPESEKTHAHFLILQRTPLTLRFPRPSLNLVISGDDSDDRARMSSSTAKKSGTGWLSRSKTKGKLALSVVTGSSTLPPSSQEKKDVTTTAVAVSVGAREAEETKVEGRGETNDDERKVVSVKGEGPRERESSKEKETTRTRIIEVMGAVPDDWPLYSCRAEDYTIGESIGFGSAAVVHLAHYQPVASTSKAPRPAPIVVAVKIIDVDRLSSAGDIDRLRRETQLMALSKHTNILRVRGEYMVGHKLHIATRFLSPGSLSDISKYAFPDGFDEIVVATVLKQVLHGLVYLVNNGWIHRDIKCANLLVDEDGTVLLADFGVSSSLLHEPPSVRGSRKSFVGESSSLFSRVRRHL